MTDGATTATDSSNNGHAATLGTEAEINAAQSNFVGSSSYPNPVVAPSPSGIFLLIADTSILELTSQPFYVEGLARFEDLTGTIQIFVCKYTNSGNERECRLRRNGVTMELVASETGIGNAITYSAPVTWTTGIWFRLPVTRDSSNNWRLFKDGFLLAPAHKQAVTTIADTSPVPIGKLISAGFDDKPFHGWIDEIRITIGEPVYTTPFVPPNAPIPNS